MASTIKIKNSNTAGNAPSSLAQGELALNVADGNLFYGDGSSVKQDFVINELTVKGNLTAEQYIVSSSVTHFTQSFSSGSTIFGDSTDDTHQFTGSVDITGSLNIIGPIESNITASGDISASGNLISNTLTAAGLTYPTTDGDDGNIVMTDGAGGLTLQPNTAFFNVKNIHGSTLLKGTPVHATGTTGNTSEVIAASASNAPSMPATYVLAEDLDDEEEGRAILTGYLNGINTSNGFTEGDVLYVGENGGYTPNKPTGSNLIQNIGIIIKADAVNGSILIYGSGRSNDVPNISPGYAWVGNNNSVATAVATSSFVVTNANTASYVQAANIDGTIDISDQTNLAGGTNLTLSGDTLADESLRTHQNSRNLWTIFSANRELRSCLAQKTISLTSTLNKTRHIALTLYGKEQSNVPSRQEWRTRSKNEISEQRLQPIHIR